MPLNQSGASVLDRISERVERALTRRLYARLLCNADQILNAMRRSEKRALCPAVSSMDFRGGPSFRIRDLATACLTFEEVFIQRQYGGGLHDRRMAGAGVVIDVGANIGLFTYYALRSAPQARIVAFEADPANAAVLAENIAKLPPQDRERVTVVPHAVTADGGPIQFFSSPVSGWSSRYPVLGARAGARLEVPSVRLSEYLIKQGIDTIDILKVDVEGAEYDILLGDPNLLDMSIGLLLVEADREPRAEGWSFAKLLDVLRQKYRSVEVSDPEWPFPILTCSDPW